jgi:hypothetical protein
MLEVINKGPPADGGYPVGSDLHQMSDDGCPLSPDPARQSDPEWCDDPTEGEVSAAEMDEAAWGDDIGLWDTFPAEVRMGFPIGDPAASDGAMSGLAADVRPALSAARPPASRGLHPDDSPRLSVGGFSLRLAVAAALMIGGLVLLVWSASR